MKTARKKKERKGPSVKKRIRQLPFRELEAIVEKAKVFLSSEDHQKLEAAVVTLGALTLEIEAKGTSIRRLRKLLFGASTETMRAVFGQAANAPGDSESDSASGGPKSGAREGSGKKGKDKKKKARPKGHGRRGADEYKGAEKVVIPHGSLEHRGPCPECPKGRVYTQKEPAVQVRVTGMAPLQATVYEKARLRCGSCGMIFTAASPEGIGEKKYDETAAAMIGLLKYGCGFPWHRLERLQSSLGIPLPASTQWEVVAAAADLLTPAWTELIRQAAQGEVLHNDDTTMKILELDRPEPGSEGSERTGIFTSGILSTIDGERIALFFTGAQHAGENLADVLAHRNQELESPIQMCDAIAANTSGDFETIVAHCLAHGRRRFVDVAESFPEACRHVLESLGKVYHFDAVAREKGMSPTERLLFHQEKSQPIMKDLEQWLEDQIEERLVEPNSGLGQAITYMRRHWSELTLFLRKEGAPLDNNICERALKKAILHRKNALFYKTENGARVGDLFMSIIHTCELRGVDPFDYLVELQRHAAQVAKDPPSWMPWNYRLALADTDPETRQKK